MPELSICPTCDGQCYVLVPRMANSAGQEGTALEQKLCPGCDGSGRLVDYS